VGFAHLLTHLTVRRSDATPDALGITYEMVRRPWAPESRTTCPVPSGTSRIASSAHKSVWSVSHLAQVWVSWTWYGPARSISWSRTQQHAMQAALRYPGQSFVTIRGAGHVQSYLVDPRHYLAEVDAFLAESTGNQRGMLISSTLLKPGP
jgi:hypothetical protein